MPPATVSEKGKAHQARSSPSRENSQKEGIRQKICRVVDRSRLVRPSPMDWKNTGSISENTAERKLVPMIGKATSPMAWTSAS